MQDERDAAARAYLENEDAESSTYDEKLYEDGRREFLILTDEEANDLAAENIERDLWAFRADFLTSYVPEGVTADVIEAIAEKKYEDASPAIRGMVGNRFEELVEDAISSDGRGHFIAQYDGQEDEFEHDGRTWYAYRCN